MAGRSDSLPKRKAPTDPWYYALMNSRVLLRVDASEEIGSGHMMRCLTIADYLKSQQIQTLFLSQSKHFEELIASRGFEQEVLPLHSDVDAELRRTRELTARASIRVVILDVNNYHSYRDLDTYRRYLGGLKDLSLFLVSFEDFKVHPPVSDIVIIPYVGAERLSLPKETTCKYLLGARYFVLGRDFARGQKANPRSRVERILVAMGGSDPESITLKVLDAFQNTELDVGLDVVLGGLCQIRENQVCHALREYKGPLRVLRNVRNMAQVMAESDMAIINSGLMKYEAAAVGLPAIVISNNEYHSEVIRPFAEFGSIVHLGPVNDVNKRDISEAVVGLVGDRERRQQMSDAGRVLIDGGGVTRIFSQIKHITHARGECNGNG